MPIVAKARKLFLLRRLRPRRVLVRFVEPLRFVVELERRVALARLVLVERLVCERLEEEEFFCFELARLVVEALLLVELARLVELACLVELAERELADFDPADLDEDFFVVDALRVWLVPFELFFDDEAEAVEPDDLPDDLGVVTIRSPLVPLKLLAGHSRRVSIVSITQKEKVFICFLCSY